MTAHKRHIEGHADNRGPGSIGAQGGFTLSPRRWGRFLPSGPVMDDLHTLWDRHKFSVPHRPDFIAEIENKDLFSAPAPANIKTLPIKYPGGEYAIPAELEQFREALQLIIDFEHAANKHVDDYYCYIALDQRFVPKGECQRGGGLHSDAVQGKRIPHTVIDRTYLIVDHSPTRFFPQMFNMAAYPEDEYWFNAVFEEQANWSSSVLTRPYVVNAFDAYTIHTAEPVDHSGLRTQFGVTFSVRAYDRTGNTANILLPKRWDPVPRPLPANLRYLDRAYGVRPTGY